jgi:alpha-L-fucosidase
MKRSVKVKTLSLLLFGWLVSTGMFAQDRYTSDWASIDSRPVPQWFADAKFGIFIHWGVYSVPAWGPLYKDGAKNVYECYSETYWDRLANNHPLFVKHHREKYGESFKYQDFAADFKCEMYNPVEWAKLFRDAGARYVVLTSKHRV